MTGPSPDLAALREVLRSDAEKALARDTYVRANPSSLLAVLSLVDDLRAENERLREALTRIVCAEYPLDGFSIAVEALDYEPVIPLAGSPAANEEQQ